MPSPPVNLQIREHALYMRNLRMRLPFRYGKAVLVAAPLLHLRTTVESSNGRVVTGVAADMLPPKWFDKDPAKSFRDNIDDLLAAVSVAAKHYSAQSGSVFDIWHTALPATLTEGADAGLNGLTSQFGSSLFERALIDAAGKHLGLDLTALVCENALGIRPGEIFSELSGAMPSEALPEKPTQWLAIRHTIGMGDPLRDRDLEHTKISTLGLPVTVESWIRESGVRYFKIKVSGDIDADAARLETIASVLDQCADKGYRVTLDGNEQFTSAETLATWWSALDNRQALRSLWPRVLFFEQPIERAEATQVSIAALGSNVAGFPPVIIDESDDGVDTFRKAAGLGYSGVSAKNCKGVIKSILNVLLMRHLRDQTGNASFLSAEDLCNQPIVPLQQDLCVAAAFGIVHAERNGHHYGGTLSHVSRSELADVLAQHGSLYESFGDSARLRIHNGCVNTQSLQCPGLGVAGLPDFESMTPLDAWDYTSLGLDENL